MGSCSINRSKWKAAGPTCVKTMIVGDPQDGQTPSGSKLSGTLRKACSGWLVKIGPTPKDLRQCHQPIDYYGQLGVLT